MRYRPHFTGHLLQCSVCRYVDKKINSFLVYVKIYHMTGEAFDLPAIRIDMHTTLSQDKKLSYRLETGRQQRISL